MGDLRIGFFLVGVFLSLGLAPGARALDSNPFDLTGSTWELAVPPASEIKDQGKYPYCGLYAMATFLELWARGGKPSFAYPAMDTAYLGLGYNRVVGSGNRGTHPLWLAVTTQIFGAIPKGARFTGNVAWPMTNWNESHKGLIDRKITDPLLKGTFNHPVVSAPFNGRQYLASAPRIDFRHLVGLHSNLNEPTVPSTDTPPPAPLRAGGYTKTVATLNRLSAKIGMRSQYGMVTPGQFYQAVKRQLYARRPVMLSINAGLTEKKFSSYRIIASDDLVTPGTGPNYSHAVVAVGHCDKENTRDPICRLFGRYLSRTKAKECIAIQNSWGTEVHERGYVCITPRAFARIGTAAMVAAQLLRP